MSKDVCRKRRDFGRGGSVVRGWKTVCEEDIVCPPIDERPSPFDEFPEVDYEVVEARARWALEGRPGKICLVGWLVRVSLNVGLFRHWLLCG